MNLDDFRKQVRSRRRSLDSREALSLSDLTCQRLLSFARQVKWENLKVGVFRPLPDELSVRWLERELAAKGTRLYYPKIIQKDEIEFRHVPDPQASVWQVGPYGIQEPGPMAEVIVPDELDVIFVPGLAFGRSGERIGMGKGYYDRFLANAPHTLRVSLCFDLQLFPELQQNTWDQPVDWIITEAREARTERTTNWLGGRGR